MQLFTGAEPPPAVEPVTAAAPTRVIGSGGLESRIDALEQAVAELRRELAELRGDGRGQ
jgi:hypothetical protein